MRINQQALVAYSTEQMFALVMDVESYPKFLPYCTGAEILRQDNDLVEARLDLSRGPVHQNFATRNRFKRAESIELELLDGPFSKLSGLWKFTKVSDAGSRIALQLDFELRGPLKYIVTPLVSDLANRMLQSMITRADQIYARGTGHVG